MPEKRYFRNTPAALKWGIKYEDVAILIYENIYNTTINEFGLMTNEKYINLGASPDGISENGIMLEIKCPYSRKINGTISAQYYYQIQGQLEVCELDECDFLECEIKDFKDLNVIEDKISIQSQGKPYYYGCVVTYYIKDYEIPPFHFSKVNLDLIDLEDWKNQNLDLNYATNNIDCLKGININDIEEVEYDYWFCNTFDCIRVGRDPEFWNILSSKLNDCLLYTSPSPRDQRGSGMAWWA